MSSWGGEEQVILIQNGRMRSGVRTKVQRHEPSLCLWRTRSEVRVIKLLPSVLTFYPSTPLCG